MNQHMQWIPQLGMWAQQHPRLLLGCIAGVMVLMILVNLCARWRRPPQTTHGSARWATPREVAQAGLSTRHGVVIGEVRR